MCKLGEVVVGGVLLHFHSPLPTPSGGRAEQGAEGGQGRGRGDEKHGRAKRNEPRSEGGTARTCEGGEEDGGRGRKGEGGRKKVGGGWRTEMSPLSSRGV